MARASHSRRKIKPVRIFISYSRRDKRYRNALVEHLAGLQREGYVSLFHDGMIRPGETWEPRILEELRNAEVVLLLISAHFVHSEYCYRTELKIAVERHRKRKAIVIPIIVTQVDWKFLEFRELNAMPEDGVAITDRRWKNQDEAWASVAELLRGEIQYLSGKRPISEALDGTDHFVSSAQQPRVTSGTAGPTVRKQYRSLSEFWLDVRDLSPDADFAASIPGTLSQFAPMLAGPPKAKRNLHRAFRAAIEQHARFAESKRSTINACMSISAGQMVRRSFKETDEKVFLGLYNCIVRNSVPVFVSRDYYRAVLKDLFVERGPSVDGVIEGRVRLLDNSYIRRFVARHKLNDFIRSDVLDAISERAYALEVGEEGTGFRYEQEPRYLDGDIWLAVESDGMERFVTTFIDLTDPQDREEGLQRLRDDLEPMHSPRIIARYDDFRESEGLLEDSFRFGLGAPRPPGTGPAEEAG